METFTLIFDISRGGPLTFDIYRTLAASLRGLGIPPRAGSINYDRKLARTKMETYTLAFFLSRLLYSPVYRRLFAFFDRVECASKEE
jgi:hypothetical protein